jgi:GNAT superfamily N-acetyltransferase
MWAEKGLDAPWMHRSLAEFQRIIHSATMYVALDAETGEPLGMHCLRVYRRQGWCYGFLLAVASSAQREGIASRMLVYETERIRQAGFRYLKEVTATTADWSIRWHLKNGYRIIGYYHSPNDNFANYVFRKQLIPINFSSPSGIDFILRHPVYALHSSAAFCSLRFFLAYTIIRLTKDSNGHDNILGRLGRKVIHKGH